MRINSKRSIVFFPSYTKVKLSLIQSFTSHCSFLLLIAVSYCKITKQNRAYEGVSSASEASNDLFSIPSRTIHSSPPS